MQLFSVWKRSWRRVLVGAVRGVSYFVGVASAVRCHVHVYASLELLEKPGQGGRRRRVDIVQE